MPPAMDEPPRASSIRSSALFSATDTILPVLDAIDPAPASPSGHPPRDDLNHFQSRKSSDRQPSLDFHDTAALLTMWSLLIINEGTVRLIDSNPAGGMAGGRPPDVVLFIGALAEIIFGLLGLLIGLEGFVRKAHHPVITKVVMCAQAVLGLYVFVVFVFVRPAIQSVDLEEPTLDGMSLGGSRFLISLGILTSFQFSLALLGGQLICMARLVAIHTNSDFLRQKSWLRYVALLWNGNLGLAGLWTLITGILVRTSLGPGVLEETFKSPPNVGKLPGMTIWTGVVMMVWSAVGCIIVLARAPLPKFYFPAAAYVYLAAFLNYTIVQFGLIDKAPSGDVAVQAGLVFVVVFIGPFYVQLYVAQEEQRGQLR